MNEQVSLARRPKPNGEPGWVITHDPLQSSFKNSMITLVFCGVCLESLFHLLIVERKGLDVYKKYDRKMFEDKLKLLGWEDESVAKMCRRYVAARKEIVHEKAYEQNKKILTGQDEAKAAYELLEKVLDHFDIKFNKT
jgi:hypothetical protein